MASIPYNGSALWLGGSTVSYNYDVIAYNGSGEVAAESRIVTYHPSNGQITETSNAISPIMDLRGIAQIAPNQFIIVGEMVENQAVSNQTLLIIDTDFVGSEKESSSLEVQISPNPTNVFFTIGGIEAADFKVAIFDL